LHEYLDDFEPDLLRYVLGTILPETKDADFSWSDFQNKVNSELADILGNFIYRTTSFTANYFDGVVPELDNPSQKDLDTLKEIENQKKLIAKNYESFRLREAIAETMNLARIGNKYFTEMEPWRTRKEDKQVCGNTLHVCLQISAALSLLFEPIIPHKMKELRNQLGIGESFSWESINGTMLKEGAKIEKGEILFDKIEDEVVEEQLEKLKQKTQNTDTEMNFEPLKDEIDFGDFTKVDIRAGEIIEAAEIPKANKLLKLTVDLGFEERTIVSGIANYFKPNELVGQKVCVVANLAPKALMGVESNGMILMGEEEDGSLKFVETEATPGSPIN
jgi:methionyl-tRNA synthetase